MKSRSGKRRKATKQSSARVSSLAARLMALTDGEFWFGKGDGALVVTRLVRTVCASVLSQDEVKGQR